MGAPLPSPSPGDLCRALKRAGTRFSTLLRSAPDPARPAVGTWTVGETAAHVASSASFFLGVARGDIPPEALSEVTAGNAAFLASDPERDPVALADRFAAGEEALLAYATRAPGDPPLEVFRGARAPLSTLLAVELAEVLVHGWDIARASRLPWSIPPEEALLTLQGLAPLLPHLVTPGAAAGFRARFEFRPRGGRPLLLEFAAGGLAVSAPDGDPVDCHLSLDPVAYLLLSYGRTGQWRPMLTGRLLPWGRRPWVAARLPGMFRGV